MTGMRYKKWRRNLCIEREQIAHLVQKAKAGDETAMARLLEGSVIFQCRKIMKHPENAEDMAQEVLLKSYLNLDKLQEPEKFLGWANRHRLTENNAPSHDPSDWDFIVWDGQICYLWQAEEGRSAVISLPAEAPGDSSEAVQRPDVLEIPSYTVPSKFYDTTDLPNVSDCSYRVPLFDSMETGYQAINDAMQNKAEEFS